MITVKSSLGGLLLLACFQPVPPLLAQTESETAARLTENAMRLRENILFKIRRDPSLDTTPKLPGGYPWHPGIVTTVFWCGELPSGANPTPNMNSAWDPAWARNYGGTDSPDPSSRIGFLPAAFVPRQNPFYLALPYNDVSGGRTKPEASQIVPWFRQTFVQSGHTVLKDRWVAVRKGNRVCYAQWEDVGPFRTDHAQYVFGTERPRPNLNGGAGLDVSPAIRDYLRLGETDITDWRFIEVSEVPPGPWTLYGDNNSFVIDRRRREAELAKHQTYSTMLTQ
jgi:hypothetical protein